MKEINTVDAVGHVLCHDMTRIIPGVSKDAAFRKGHIVTEEDIPILLSMGKEHLYVWEKDESMYHEDEAAEILWEICAGPYTSRGEVKEGKVELFADTDGLFEINRVRLDRVNALGEMMIAARNDHVPVKKGDKLAGTRVIPLVIEKEKMERARAEAGPEPLLRVRPFRHCRVGIVVTGSEVFSGRIEDQFGPAIERKMADYDTEVLGREIVGDDPAEIAAHIQGFLRRGADLICCTGGMSVDPDDTTPSAIRASGAEIVTYGAPVLPGAMFLLAYTDQDVPIMGLPGCVMYSRRTIFDLVLPRVMCGDRLSRAELARLGSGGLCLDCKVCTWPNCGFGKGGAL
ncbi:MAG: molybdopterin-binding protein [Anaerovoracaceae bacterium]|jgi:molybdenum cofactor synthesis domain-containing protein